MRNLDLGAAVRFDYDADGFPVVQRDAYGEEVELLEPLEMHHPWGFLGMPHQGERDPQGTVDPSKCTQLLVAWQNESGHAWALGDPRITHKLPRVLGGGSVWYGGNVNQPAYGYFAPITGSFQLKVPYAFAGTSPTKAITIDVDVSSPGAEVVRIQHGVTSVEVTATGVQLGNATAMALVLEPVLSKYLDALEACLPGIASPSGGPALATFKVAATALRALLATKVTTAA
jgi:YD repeat-containing protein